MLNFPVSRSKVSNLLQILIVKKYISAMNYVRALRKLFKKKFKIFITYFKELESRIHNLKNVPMRLYTGCAVQIYLHTLTIYFL